MPRPLNTALLTVLVATLGYFVDVFDLWIFMATRVASLKDIGVPEAEMLDTGILLLNLQMGGMLLGGIVFGMLGDRLGRTRVMFISILTYSLATLSNAFVHNVEAFAALRFLSGFGLAGELGLGTTLVSEVLSKERRGLGVGTLVTFGVLGALASGLAAQHFDWRTCYIIGGVAGVALLIFRMRVLESGLFKTLPAEVPRGNLLMIFSRRERLVRFLCCVLLGMPTWYAHGILLAFSKEILPALELPVVATAVLLVYGNLGIAVGDALSVWFSQIFKTRKWIYTGFALLAVFGISLLLYLPRPINETGVKALFFLLSVGAGVWVLMAMIAAESFGTNLRATVATSVPNFARGSVVAMTLALTYCKQHMPLPDAVLLVGVVAYALPLLALLFLPETFGRDLNYLEEDK